MLASSCTTGFHCKIGRGFTGLSVKFSMGLSILSACSAIKQQTSFLTSDNTIFAVRGFLTHNKVESNEP